MAQVYKRNGEWSYRVFYFDENGKRRSINNSGFKKKGDASNAARELEIKRDQVGISKSLESISFIDYFKKWVNIYKKGRYGKITQDKYQSMENFLANYFKEKKLKDITKLDYQQMLDAYAKTHVKSTVSRLNGTIRSAIKDALEQQIIHLDFTRNALISSNKESKKIKYFEINEAYQIRNYCLKNSSIQMITRYAIALSLATGMRYGEIVGLTWDDIDFKKNTINITKTYDYKNRTGFKPTTPPPQLDYWMLIQLL